MGSQHWLILPVAAAIGGIILRQLDRWWYAPRRRGSPQPASIHDILMLQRQRSNNWTAPILLLGHWLEIIAWWYVAGRLGLPFDILVSVTIAFKFRQLQEVSHFAIHRVLTRNCRFGFWISEVTVHGPMALVPTTVRLDRHAKKHHPNATIAGLDPNLTDLTRAGFVANCGRTQFYRALLFPLTLRGVMDSTHGVVRNLLTPPRSYLRVAAFLSPILLAFVVGGIRAILFGLVIPRLLLYPQLAWLSLLAEHRWFDSNLSNDRLKAEAGRCLRLYPHNQLNMSIARLTWLPYGDAFHYAHSSFPGVRWNYLARLDALLPRPSCTPTRFMFGKASLLNRHLLALERNGRDQLIHTQGLVA
jgi:fatty acid desaturase